MLDILAMEEKFTGEYKRAFAKISMYGTMTPIDSAKYEDRVLNIYDVLLSAQNDGKPVEKIIGRDMEAFCKTYYANNGVGDWLGNILKRVFGVMLILVAYSLAELFMIITDEADNVGFFDMRINAAPFLIGVLVGLVVCGIEDIAKHRLLLRTDKIKNSVYVVGALIVFAVCVAVGLVLFGNIDAKMPLWVMLTVSGGYSILYILFKGIMRYRENGTLKNTDRLNRQELKEFNKELTLEYDIRTSAEGMVEQFDKMKRKYAKKGKPEPQYKDFVKKMHDDHKMTRYIEVIFVFAIVAICAVNIALNIGSEDMAVAIIAAVVAAAVSLIIFRFAMSVIREVEKAQNIVLDECDRNGIDIYQYVAKAQEKNPVL